MKRKSILFLLILFLGATLFTCATRERTGAKCQDGRESSAIGSGACSHHNGVKSWKYKYWWD